MPIFSFQFLVREALCCAIIVKRERPSASSSFNFELLTILQGWFVSAGLIFALIPGLNFLSSLAVAACLTPTDPILAAAVVGGKYADKHVPAHIRHLLAAESGCNDGAAFPFLYIALYLILDNTTKDAIRDWFLDLWLCASAIIPCWSTH